jgi:hypothetical protein
MQINNAKNAFILFLKLHPLFDGSQVITQMYCARRLDAREIQEDIFVLGHSFRRFRGEGIIAFRYYLDYRSVFVHSPGIFFGFFFG